MGVWLLGVTTSTMRARSGVGPTNASTTHLAHATIKKTCDMHTTQAHVLNTPAPDVDDDDGRGEYIYQLIKIAAKFACACSLATVDERANVVVVRSM